MFVVFISFVDSIYVCITVYDPSMYLLGRYIMYILIGNVCVWNLTVQCIFCYHLVHALGNTLGMGGFSQKRRSYLLACFGEHLLPLALFRASSSTLCLVCFTTMDSNLASSTRDLRRAG